MLYSVVGKSIDSLVHQKLVCISPYRFCSKKKIEGEIPVLINLHDKAEIDSKQMRWLQIVMCDQGN